MTGSEGCLVETMGRKSSCVQGRCPRPAARSVSHLPFLPCASRRASIALRPLPEHVKVMSCSQRRPSWPLGPNPGSGEKSPERHSIRLWSNVCHQRERGQRLTVQTHLFLPRALYIAEESEGWGREEILRVGETPWGLD